MEKLKLEHLAPYFPYGLKLKGGVYYREMSAVTLAYMVNGNEYIKPILRPLSDLTKEIEHNGKRFVPIDELRKMSDVPYSESFRFEDDGFKFTTEVMHSEYGTHQWIDYDFNSNNQYEMYSRLFEWHFDVFGLIDKGLAIDINTI